MPNTNERKKNAKENKIGGEKKKEETNEEHIATS